MKNSELFVGTWQTSYSVRQVAVIIGIKCSTAITYANTLRSLGVPLKKMKITNMKNIESLRELATSLVQGGKK